MKKAICGITRKEFNCPKCKIIEDKYCPYWELDDALEHLVDFKMKLMEDNFKEKNGNN